MMLGSHVDLEETDKSQKWVYTGLQERPKTQRELEARMLSCRAVKMVKVTWKPMWFNLITARTAQESTNWPSNACVCWPVERLKT